MVSELDFGCVLRDVKSYAGLTCDSRKVIPGGVFVAGGGKREDQQRYFEQATALGAGLIVGEVDRRNGAAIPFVKVADFRDALAQLASQYYGSPSNEMLMVGITGTCGKTTTTYLLESILQAAGHVVGVLGTVDFRWPGHQEPSVNTTPGADELNRMLRTMRVSGCTAVVMEVSSHALVQKRTQGILFDAVVFTNLSHEHLDYHGSMEAYFESKSLLFTEYARRARDGGKKPVGAINVGGSYGQRLGEISTNGGGAFERLVPFDPTGKVDALRWHQLVLSRNSIDGELDGLTIRSPLVGAFNADNILCAVAAARGLGLADAAIEAGVSKLRPVPGRLEPVENDRGVNVFVDYSHKPEALACILTTLRSLLCDGQALCAVVGCGGDRDRGKRPIMGRIACEQSDRVWITSDNPRSEDPEAIVQDIVAGVSAEHRTKVSIVVDRRTAIREACRAARSGDIVVIAGKGHERYQIIGAKTLPFDDVQEASAAMAALG